jgi:5-methylcytosine-specific restriction endonuclease McrA
MFFSLSTRADGRDHQCKQCQKKYKQNLYAKWKLINKCRYCPKQATIQAGKKDYCIECWVDYIVKAMVRATKKRYHTPITADEIEYLVEGLYNQLIITPRCPYTNERLIPGENVDLDHKIPKIRAPELIFRLENLQWTSRTYNKAKADMTDGEFAARFILKACN